jgi:hypothetical protein
MNNCCKYCLEDNKESDHPLIYPCQCADGVHPNCLAIWLLVRPTSNDKGRCEICHVNYIGVIIPPLTPPPPPSPLLQPLSDEEDDDDVIVPPPLPQQRNNDIDLDFICCQCHAVEAGSYITGAVFGLTSGVLTMQPGFKYNNSNVDLAFKVFIGLCSCLNLMGLICTSRRYYKRCIDGRRVYANEGN